MCVDKLGEPIGDRVAKVFRLERHRPAVLPAAQLASSSTWANSVSNTPSSTEPASARVRSTHHAVSSETTIRAVPTASPICHGRGILCISTSKSAGTRKSRSRRVAKRMSPRMRETLNVLTVSRSRSCPMTYQLPSSRRSAYGFTTRSAGLGRRGAGRGTGRFAASRSPTRASTIVRRAPASSPERSPGTRFAVSVGEHAKPERPGAILERKSQWLGVGELPFEVVDGVAERCELVVVELEPVEGVVLRAERVELLARELVPLRLGAGRPALSALRDPSRTDGRRPHRTSRCTPRHST